MKRYDKIKEALEHMSTADIIAMHNAYCDATNNMDDCIYSMDDFDEIMGGESPLEIARKCFYGHEFNPNHDYFRFNGYANLESFDYAPGGNSGIYVSDIAEYIDREEDALGDCDIEAIFEEEQDDDSELQGIA